MPSRIVIVGDVPERPSRQSLLDDLRARYPEVSWDWYKAEGDAFQIPSRVLNRLLHDLRHPQVDQEPPRIVKLHNLNGRDANQIFRAHSNPVLAPQQLSTGAELVAWLGSTDAGLIPPRYWQAPTRTAALIALLTKLIKNKAWNKDVQGHAWVKEDDLLGQSPVLRPDFPLIFDAACDLLERGSGSLFITKGGKQGKTPKEWCIQLAFVAQVKRSLVDRSLDSLRTEPALATLMAHVDADTSDAIDIDEALLPERVLAICRERG